MASGPLITTINDISIHALREEGDVIRASSSITICEFLSTPSARRATHQDCPEKGCNKNFYPRPPRGGRRYLARPERHDLRISIHALREEGDWSGSIRWAQHSHFYPRPPRGGRRILYWFDFTFTEFLSTPSARRATLQCLVTWSSHRYFYPRPPRGGRPYNGHMFTKSFEISIHALREEGDHGTSSPMWRFQDFYPRPPRGGRHHPDGNAPVAS